MANVNEQDALTFAAAQQGIEIELDLSNYTLDVEIREYVKVDGATYRQISYSVFPSDFDTGTASVLISFEQKNSDYKVTLQTPVAEGGAVNVPYRYQTRSLA